MLGKGSEKSNKRKGMGSLEMFQFLLGLRVLSCTHHQDNRNDMAPG